MNASAASILTDTVLLRRHPQGGFEEKTGAGPRPDSTAWCIVALSMAGVDPAFLNESRDFLVRLQSDDGRIGFLPSIPEAWWPTPLAVLAWLGSERHSGNIEKAAAFLLSHSGRTWAKPMDSPVGHDTSLKGWSWIEGTYSWVEPTSLSVIALRQAAYGSSTRIEEAVDLLLDRQIETGGWNFGNTTIFGKTIPPLPAPTGMALQALASQVPRDEISKSIEYLKAALDEVRTPFSLSWAMAGLSAWEESPRFRERYVQESLSLQKHFGEYGASDLALLLISLLCPKGLSIADHRVNSIAEKEPQK